MYENYYPEKPSVQAVPQVPGTRKVLPYSIAALVVSVLSLSFMSLLGWIPAIIAMNYANKALDLAEQNPDSYTPSSVGMAKAGKKMSAIGLVLGILGMFVTVLYFYLIISLSMHPHRYY